MKDVPILAANGETRIHGRWFGEGPPVLLIPSLGRSAEDFWYIARALVSNGRSAITFDPRGVGQSSGPLEGLTLHNLAEDALAVLRECCDVADVLGHAFGTRVARCLSADYPEHVGRLVLLSAGGLVEPPQRIHDLRRVIFQRDRAARIEALAEAFFAESSDPSVWADGWYTKAARAQSKANLATNFSDWWHGGCSSKMLIVQGVDDRDAVPENGRLMEKLLGARVELAEVHGAGHALLPEQPKLVTEHILKYLEAPAPISRCSD